ncbi:hypothetical protein MRX96_005646 [Rhipicephalus microplus]
MTSTLRLVLIEHVLVRLARYGSGLKANLLEKLNGVLWEPLGPRWTGGFLSAEAHIRPPYDRLEIPLPVFDFALKDDAALRPLQMARAAPRVYRPMFRAIYHWVFNLEFSATSAERNAARSLVQYFSDLRLCLEHHYSSLSGSGKE